MKKGIALVILIIMASSGFLWAEEDKREKRKFFASSLWGVRRGPNAPKPSPSPSPKTDPSTERAKMMNDYYEEKAKSGGFSYKQYASETLSGSSDCATQKS